MVALSASGAEADLAVLVALCGSASRALGGVNAALTSRSVGKDGFL
jgi:hypothetical protein